ARRSGAALPKSQLSRAQIAALMEHSWPGNLRELHNAADRFVLGVADEPFEARADGEVGPQSLAAQVARFEQALIAAELRRHGGNVIAASDALGVPAKTLYDKLRRLKISSDKRSA